MRILYVEDNPANVLLVKRVAKMGNHEVHNFMEGAEAIAKYDSIDPHLVLMDVQISGGMNGLEVVKKLRELGYETPIIAVTAYAMVGDRERCIDAGCTDYMAKPLPVAELVQVFERYAKSVAQSVPTPEKVATKETSAVLRTTSEVKAAPITDALPKIKEPEPIAPVIEAPVVAPVTEAPIVEAPAVVAPVTEVPAIEVAITTEDAPKEPVVPLVTPTKEDVNIAKDTEEDEKEKTEPKAEGNAPKK